MHHPMSITRSTAVALGAAALVLSAGGAASAAGASHRDATGDAPTAASDITRVVVKNGEKTLMVQAKLLRATRRRTHVVVTLTPAAEGAATYVVRTVEVGHRVGATLESTPSARRRPRRSTAPGVKAAVSQGRRGQVHVRVPSPASARTPAPWSRRSPRRPPPRSRPRRRPRRSPGSRTPRTRPRRSRSSRADPPYDEYRAGAPGRDLRSRPGTRPGACVGER